MTAVDTLLAAETAMRTVGATAVVPREVIEISGPDAASYLQGQVSQDISTLGAIGAWSFILDPSGRVVCWMRVHRVADDHFLLEVESGFGEILLARVRRFLMRTKVTITEPATWSLIARRGPIDGSPSAGGALAIPGALSGALVGTDVGGSDLLVRLSLAATIAALDDEAVDPAALERHRIAHGVPAMGAELTEATIPAEAGPVVIAASVSFSKGCYTGQELVARIDSRGGNVPRPVRLLQFDSDAFAPGHGPAVGDSILVEGAEVGVLTSAAVSLGNALGALALAPLPRALAVGDRVSVRTSIGEVGEVGEVGATVVEPPAGD